MTTVAKKFIELSDILALSFVCKECGVSVSVSPKEYQARRKKVGFLKECPICNHPWTQVGGSTCELTIFKFVEAFGDLAQIISGDKVAFPVGFTLAIEIKNDKLEPPR